MAQAEHFNVVQFFPDDTYDYIKRSVPLEEAMIVARDYIDPSRPANKLGVIVRLIITDAGDSTVFEYKRGAGITFPHSAGITAWNTKHGFTGVSNETHA